MIFTHLNGTNGLSCSLFSDKTVQFSVAIYTALKLNKLDPTLCKNPAIHSMTYLRMLAAISPVAIICVSVPIFLILIFQTSKRYDFDSVWACVCHTATCHDNHQVGLAQRHLLFCLIMHLNESFNFQKMFGSFFYFTAAKFALSVQR